MPVRNICICRHTRIYPHLLRCSLPLTRHGYDEGTVMGEGGRWMACSRGYKRSSPLPTYTVEMLNCFPANECAILHHRCRHMQTSFLQANHPYIPPTSTTKLCLIIIIMPPNCWFCRYCSSSSLWNAAPSIISERKTFEYIYTCSYKFRTKARPARCA